jgi:transcriptional regulator with XRE-family HTH domain
MITAAQIRAARGLLKWTQAALAAKSGLSIVTLNMIESETVQPRKSSLAAIQQALESGGVEFIGTGGGLGVRFAGMPAAGQYTPSRAIDKTQ